MTSFTVPYCPRLLGNLPPHLQKGCSHNNAGKFVRSARWTIDLPQTIGRKSGCCPALGLCAPMIPCGLAVACQPLARTMSR